VCICTAKVLKNSSVLLFPFNPCTYNSQNRHIFSDTYIAQYIDICTSSTTKFNH
jgi:hypothetical protein